jgi:hypothetical protein
MKITNKLSTVFFDFGYNILPKHQMFEFLA